MQFLHSMRVVTGGVSFRTLLLGCILLSLTGQAAHGVATILTPIDSYLDGANGGDDLDGAYSVAISPTGTHVYVASARDDAVTVFSRDADSGALTFVESQVNGPGLLGLDGVAGVTVSPDGKNVYTSSLVDTAVGVFTRDVTTGELTYLNAVTADWLSGAYGVIVSQDGAHVYLASQVASAVVKFDRDSSTGALSNIETHFQGTNGVDGLTGANSIALSPDGKNAYVASLNDSAVVIFDRNVTTGSLSFVRALKEGVDGVEGLQEATQVAVSPDGKSVYVVSYVGSSVASFSRDAATGDLTFFDALFGGEGGIESLAFGNAIAVSPDGSHVIVGGEDPSTLTIFSRSSGKTALTFEQAIIDDGTGENDVTGMVGPVSIAVAPSGRNVYVASFSGAVHAFDRQFNPADVNGDSAVDAVDVQFVINSALGLTVAFNCDINNDGEVDAVDVQIVINRALGL
jgi:6-phosphogluconolactonase (cycloisomerase 2 family)